MRGKHLAEPRAPQDEQAQLIGMSRDYDLAVTDLTGRELARSQELGNSSEKVRIDLPAGRFLVAVLPKQGQFDRERPYRLNLTPIQGGGNS